jgi:hypothetical protein
MKKITYDVFGFVIKPALAQAALTLRLSIANDIS